MSFKLSEQLDADSTTAFKLHQLYMERNAHLFPESVLELYKNKEWNGGTMQKGPMDSQLNSLSILPEEEKIVIKLTKRYGWEGSKIIITYSGVTEYNIKITNNNELIWRFEQFRYINGYHKYGIQDKIFIHDIEWTSGEIFSIEAKDIKFEFFEK